VRDVNGVSSHGHSESAVEGATTSATPITSAISAWIATIGSSHRSMGALRGGSPPGRRSWRGSKATRSGGTST
jgi:hypothetical protein